MELLAGQGLDGAPSRLRRAHGDEGETTRLARVPVGDDVHFRHRSSRGEKILQFEFSRIEGDVTNEHFRIHAVLI